MNPLAPLPMSPADIADLVARVRLNSIEVTLRGIERAGRQLRKPATTRARCAARYSRLVGCSHRKAAEAFGLRPLGAHDAWGEIYPNVHTNPRRR